MHPNDIAPRQGRAIAAVVIGAGNRAAGVLVCLLLAACGGDGSNARPAERRLLAGSDGASALAAFAMLGTDPASAGDIELGHILTRVEVILDPDATVAQFNAAANSIGATAILTSQTGSPALTLQVPRQAGVAALNTLARRLDAEAGILFTLPARQFDAAVLPERDPGMPVAKSDVGHLLISRFPQAWNAWSAAGADCLPRSATIYLWDNFGQQSLRPSFLDQIDPTNFFADAALAAVSATDPAAGHGYDVALVLAAGFDAVPPTGALPFADCTLLHQVEAAGRGFNDAIDALHTKLRAEGADRFVLNVSFGFPEPLCGAGAGDTCSTQNIGTTTAASVKAHIRERVASAVYWARLFRDAALEPRMLITLAAGNIDDAPGEIDGPAGFFERRYAGFRDARFVSPVSLATHLAELSALLTDTGLWRSGVDAAAPDATFTAAEAATVVADVERQLGTSTSLPAANLVIVNSASCSASGSVACGEEVAIAAHSRFSYQGGALSAVGEHVEFNDRQLDGTSFAAPQVAGLAAYLWTLSDALEAAPVSTTIDLLVRTGSAIHLDAAPLIDAYAAVLLLDSIGPAGVRRIRSGIMDANGDGNFDHLDLIAFSDGYALDDPNRPALPVARDFSRFDVNGDGYTGGIAIAPFDLDVNGLDGLGRALINTVDETIEGYAVTFNEAALSDQQILCFYAYSELYASAPGNRAEALVERTRLLGPDRCVGVRMNTLLPAQISSSAELTVTLDVPAGNGQFAPAANLLVELTPTCANVDSSSGRTDANGRLSTTITPIGGCVALSIQVVARAEANMTPLAQSVVTASIGAGLLSGDLALTDVNFPGGITFDPLNINPKRLGSVSAFVRAEVAADGVGISILEASGIASTFMETSGRLECFFEDGRPSEGPFDIVTTTTHTQFITGATFVADQIELLGPVERIESSTGGTESCGNQFTTSVALSSLFVLRGARVESGGRTIAIDFNQNTADQFGGTRVVTGRLEP